MEHRIGGLEKEDGTGDVNYDPFNHELLVRVRATKIANIADAVPPLEVHGPDEGDVLVLGWGSTLGPIMAAVNRVRARGGRVASAQLRYLNPLPNNLGSIISRYQRILVPELNSGQLVWLLRARFLIDAVAYNKTQGMPFSIQEIETKIESLMGQ